MHGHILEVKVTDTILGQNCGK